MGEFQANTLKWFTFELLRNKVLSEFSRLFKTVIYLTVRFSSLTDWCFVRPLSIVQVVHVGFVAFSLVVPDSICSAPCELLQTGRELGLSKDVVEDMDRTAGVEIDEHGDKLPKRRLLPTI